MSVPSAIYMLISTLIEKFDVYAFEYFLRTNISAENQR